MGNCSFKGTADSCPSFIRVLTDSGTILQFRSPKVAAEILEDYPGYGIFPRGHASSPLADDEGLVRGQFYYLLPLEEHMHCDEVVTKQVQHVEVEPPKISSADFVENLASGSALEVLPSQENGVWKVKLVISTKHLEEILSEQVNTEALIEKMRMAACASSAGVLPKRTKRSWVVGWKPAVLCNVFKVPIDNGK